MELSLFLRVREDLLGDLDRLSTSAKISLVLLARSLNSFSFLVGDLREYYFRLEYPEYDDLGLEDLDL